VNKVERAAEEGGGIKGRQAWDRWGRWDLQKIGDVGGGDRR